MNRSKYFLMARPTMPIDKLDPWEIRHNDAITNPQLVELPIIAMLQDVTLYVRQQEMVSDGRPWFDYVLGAGIGQMLSGIRTLLNGDIGRLDGGTLDAAIMELAARCSFDLDTMDMIR